MFTVLKGGEGSGNKTFCGYSFYLDPKAGWECGTEFGAIVFGKELRNRGHGI